MKILIVAHPDDEILWFEPTYFDRIYIVFLNRHDKPDINVKRLNCIANHPLKEKISLLFLEESGFWKDSTRYKQHNLAKKQLIECLIKLSSEQKISEIFTHNEMGEYGHDDHILVNESVISVFSNLCPIWMPNKFIQTVSQYKPKSHQVKNITINIKNFFIIREIYRREKAWTWNMHYHPNEIEIFYKHE